MRAYANLTREIDQLPDGPETGAFFDFDGTIIAGYSAVPLMRMQMKRGELTARQLATAGRAMVDFGLGNTSFSAMMVINAQFLAGLKESDYVALGEELYQRELAKIIYPESRALIEAHLRKGHTVAIISSAMPYQVEPAAQRLNVPHIKCSRMAVKRGRFTGEVLPPVCFGEGKVLAAEEIAKECGVDLSRSFFYSDSDDDIELLEHVGNPRPVNPNKKLTAIAQRRKWPVQRFDSRGKSGASKWLRSVLASGTMLLTSASSLPIWALTGSKRDAQNFSASMFADIASALVGLKLNVNGEANLWKQRPAIFLFNHQSKADMIIVAQLLRRDFSGVARKHEKSPKLFEQAMDLGGVALLDLSDPKQAINTMRELGARVQEENLSVAIAPEGTRSSSKQLGAFKKGAFQLALQAGVPVVPIVIHNAMDVSSRDEFLYHSATVDVDVLPPIDTSEWKKSTLNRHIKEVRELFLEQLGQNN